MKISKQLKQTIQKAINGVVLDHLLVIDHHDRVGKISHESWQTIHKSGCEMMEDLKNAVLKEIESYHK